jgi:hypothetical protein
MENPGQFLVKWKRPRYYNAVDTFILMQGLADSQNSRYRVKATTNPDDTVFQVVTGSFGDNMSFNLKLVPRKKIAGINSPSANAGGYITGYLGYSFDKNDMWELFPAGQDGFIYYDCENIKRFSFSQRKTSDELKYQMTGCYGCLTHSPHISNTGKYLSNIVGCESSLLLAKTSDLNSYSLHNLGTITGSFYYYLCLADNGTALMHNANGGYDLYNAVSSTHIGHYDQDYNYQSQLKISADGSYFTIGYDSLRMIKVSGNSFSEMWKIKYSQSYLKFYEFNPANPDQMIFWEGSRLVTKSCSDLSVISSIPLADNILLNIDYENNELLSFKTGHLYVRSLADGSVKYDIPFNVNPDYWTNKCLLINHTIVSAMGVMYFLQ